MTGILNILAGSISSAIKDGYFNLVSLLLPGSGTNGAQNNTFLDSSSNNFTITRNGNTTQGTFSPFSQTGWGNYFDGSGDYLTGTITAVNNTTMTMECWVYFIARDDATGDHLIQVDNGSNANYAVTHDGNGVARFLSRNNTGGAIFDIFSSSAVLQNNRWHHIVGVRNASAASLYVDGTRVGTVSSPSVSSTDGTSLYVASNGGTGREPNGYISNARIVSGTAVYDPTSSSLTVPTSPLDAVSGTRILTCQSNRFVDNSGNSVALTVNGTPSVQAFSPFAPTAAYSAATNGGSGYFDGTGDYLSFTLSTAIGTGAFTYECWGYKTADTGSYLGNLASSLNGSSDRGLNIEHNGNVRMGRSVAGQFTDLTSSVSVPKNAWTHFALVRTSGGAVRLFVNGILAAYNASITYDINMTNHVIGRQYPSEDAAYITGYVSSVRITNTEVYSTASTTTGTQIFTPPTGPLTAITGTRFLGNFTNAGITDATAKNDLETVGNAQISTTQSKFGGSSMYFDGNGDYLIAPNSKLYAFQSGDFTVEMWIYPSTVSAVQYLFDTRDPASTTSAGIQWYINASAKLGVYVGTTSVITASTSSISANTWTHLALVKNGSTWKIYINGTADATTGTNSTALTQEFLTIACSCNQRAATTTDKYSGYIDDLRITNGLARYTSNFTAPTAAFPLQ